MVDRALFFPWYDSEISDYSRCTAKAGWSIIPEGYRSFADTFPEGRSVAVDKSLWDWTMPDWVVEAYFDLKLSQVRNPTQPYVRACWNRMQEVLGPDCVIQLPTGSVYRQCVTGMMKSGWLLTLSMNSMAQDFQHRLAWGRAGFTTPQPLIWAMGDDTIMAWGGTDEDLRRYSESLSTTGCIVKFVHRSREFAGFSVSGGVSHPRVEPLYPEKHKYMLKYVKPEMEQMVLGQLALLYALAGESWFDQVKSNADFPIGPAQVQWAKGTLSLRLYDSVWAGFKF